MNNFLSLSRFLLLISFVLSFALSAFAAPSDLDPSFGASGIVRTNFGSQDRAHALIRQPDGKLVVVGEGNPSSSGNIDFALARYNGDGSLDALFGSGGKVATDFFGNTDFAKTVAMQPDGKIVVGGSSRTSSGSYGFTLARYNSDGSLDGSFGAGGKVNIFLWGANDSIEQIVMQPDGKIVAAGYAETPAPNFGLVRYNADGSLDSSFGSNGKVSLDFAGRYDAAYSAVLQSDGKIVLAGYSFVGTGSNDVDFSLARFNVNGTLDTSFGTNGKTTTDFSNSRDESRGLAVQPDGKIVAAGIINNNSLDVNDFALARYSSDGILDTSFGNNGRVTTDFPAQFSSYDIAYDVIVQPNGKIVAVGNGASGNFVLARYLASGALDAGFGNGGRVITQFPNSSGQAEAVLIQPDGKIVAAGTSSQRFSPYVTSFALARFIGDVAQPYRAPFDFDGDSKTDIGIFRPSGGEWWINRSAANQTTAAQFGASSDTPVPNDYTGDGKTDIAFYRPASGQWFILRSEDATFYAFPFGASGDVPAPGDFDADGKSDQALFRPSQATWYIKRSSDGGVTIQSFGIAEDKPVAADYDADGKTDIAVFRPSTSAWWIQKSTTGTVAAVQFGQSGDKTVPGDYTGDGKADIAFWRPSNGFWFILRSDDASYYGFPFGVSTDVPAPGDYDGDGKMDAAVFRTSNSGWYLNRSTAGFLGVQFGTSGDQPIPNVFVR